MNLNLLIAGLQRIRGRLIAAGTTPGAAHDEDSLEKVTLEVMDDIAAITRGAADAPDLAAVCQSAAERLRPLTGLRGA